MINDLSRRNFLKTLAASALLFESSNFYSAQANDETKITILHTNDTHSQIEPFPEGTRNAGMGGVARRASFVRQIRSENPNTLLLDGGDSFQGTPYYNFYHGELEIKSMSAIGYDIVTLGNHDFDEGVDSLVKALQHAKFDIVSVNYDVSNSALKDFVKPYVIRKLSGIKVGVLGLGIDFDGLVVADKHIGVSYQDPIKPARAVVDELRNKHNVDLIVAASHLGYKYDNEPDRVCDVKVAEAIPEIDFIVGGHTHTFMKEPAVIKHQNGRQTLIFQVGFAGINVGRVDFTFKKHQLVSWQAGIFNMDTEQISQLYSITNKII
ncbi:MAG: metallophosphatase [Blastocatellia bacterium]